MKGKTVQKFGLSVILFLLFAVWTFLLGVVDVQPIGPKGTAVGFATINQWVHQRTGVSMPFYNITDWLGLVPVAIGFGFAALGVVQWIRRKQIWWVDFSLLILGGFYLLMLAVYLLFETVIINYRPVLIGGYLEVSYPSSTTLLVLCVIPTTMRQLRLRLRKGWLRGALMLLLIGFMLFMVLGRLLAGVHWLTDIIGGTLLAGGLVVLYDAVCCIKDT